MLFIRQGHQTSYQVHKERDERLVVVTGSCVIRVEEEWAPFVPYKEIFIQRGSRHRITATTNCTLLEISTGDFSEDDIVRIKDDYGRVQAR